MTPAARQAFMDRYKREHGILGNGFCYAAYRASFPPELRQYVPHWGEINGVPIEEVAKMLEERDKRQASEFDKLAREAYAWAKLLATGEKSPSDPLFIEWYGRAITLESGAIAVEYPEDPNVP